MPAPPCHQFGHVIVSDLGHQFVLAEIVEQDSQQPFGLQRPGQMLCVFGPIAPRHIVEPQRGVRVLGLRDQQLRALALLPLYRFGFPLVGLLGRAEKATTSDLKIVLPERGARVASDGHGVTFRVCTVMNSLRSASVNILRWRFLPWPRATYFSAPNST